MEKTMVEHLDAEYQWGPLSEQTDIFNTPQFETINLFGSSNNSSPHASSELCTTISNACHTESTDMFGSVRTGSIKLCEESKHANTQASSELFTKKSNGHHTESIDMFKSVHADKPTSTGSNWWCDFFNVTQSTANGDSSDMFSSMRGDNASSDLFSSHVESLCSHDMLDMTNETGNYTTNEKALPLVLNTPSDNTDVSEFRGFSSDLHEPLLNCVDINNTQVHMTNIDAGPSHYFSTAELSPSTTLCSVDNRDGNEDMIQDSSETLIVGALSG